MKNKMRIAAMADLHVQENSYGFFREIFQEISKKADILLLCGDLTHEGRIKEAQVLGEELSFCTIPVLGILGNHDYTNDEDREIKKILSDHHLNILDTEPYLFKDVSFAGVKGFCGGFDKHVTAPFGEKILKEFVMEAVSEAMKLEQALRRMNTEKKIVMLHYSPIRETVVGEPPEIYNLLGTSRLNEPIDNFGANAVFHGHAHYGSPRGKTPKGIPVYNVSFSLLSRTAPYKPYIIIEV